MVVSMFVKFSLGALAVALPSPQPGLLIKFLEAIMEEKIGNYYRVMQGYIYPTTFSCLFHYSLLSPKPLGRLSRSKVKDF